MKIRAKLKHVVFIAQSDYELEEIKRLTRIVKDDPEATIKIDISLSIGQLTNFQMVGKVPLVNWEDT